MFLEDVMPIKHTTDTTFSQDVLEASVPTIVDFWAPWCGPCKAIAPELEKLQAAYEGKLRVVKHNVDENPLTARTLEIKSIPTIIFYPGKGQAPLSIVGATTAKDMIKRFRLDEVVR
jgi:thioredoxin 1